MDELVNALKVALADTFTFYLKAHGFHWNIEGPEFPQYHAFFETIYTDTFEAADGLAERVRTLDSYAPGSLSRFKELTTIKEEVNILSAHNMVVKLASDNQKVIVSLAKARELAEKNKKFGIVNFLEDRLDKHEKHGWMLRATAKVK